MASLPRWLLQRTLKLQQLQQLQQLQHGTPPEERSYREQQNWTSGCQRWKSAKKVLLQRGTQQDSWILGWKREGSITAVHCICRIENHTCTYNWLVTLANNNFVLRFKPENSYFPTLRWRITNWRTLPGPDSNPSSGENLPFYQMTNW